MRASDLLPETAWLTWDTDQIREDYLQLCLKDLERDPSLHDGKSPEDIRAAVSEDEDLLWAAWEDLTAAVEDWMDGQPIWQVARITVPDGKIFDQRMIATGSGEDLLTGILPEEHSGFWLWKKDQVLYLRLRNQPPGNVYVACPWRS